MWSGLGDGFAKKRRRWKASREGTGDFSTLCGGSFSILGELADFHSSQGLRMGASVLAKSLTFRGTIVRLC